MGRHDGKGNVDMVDVLDTDPNHIDQYIATSRAYSTEAVPPLVNLLGDALTLGQMLNPKKSKVPVVAGVDPKAKSTEFKNMIRCVVFKSARFDHEVLVSLNRTDACPVIKVFPKFDLGLDPETDLYLRANDRAFFEDQVMSIAQRRIWDATVKDALSGFASNTCIELTDTLRNLESNSANTSG